MSDIIKLSEDEMFGENPSIPIDDGVFLAGGSVRAWFCRDEKVMDYDLFFTSPEKLALYKKTHLSEAKVLRDEEFLFECIKDDKKIQLIKRLWPQSVEELFKRFDFHLCQFAVTSDGIWTTKKAVLSVLRKRLSFNNHQTGFEVDTLRRAFKYAKKGYSPCIGCLADLARIFKDADIDKQIQFYPDGKTKRVIRFD